MIYWDLVMRIGPEQPFPLDFGDELQLTKFNYLKTLDTRHAAAKKKVQNLTTG